MGKSNRVGRIGLSKAARISIKADNSARVQKKQTKQAKLVAKDAAVKPTTDSHMEVTEKKPANKSSATAVSYPGKKKYVTEDMIDYVTLMKSGKSDRALNKSKLLRLRQE
jgi:hypothetical protein